MSPRTTQDTAELYLQELNLLRIWRRSRRCLEQGGRCLEGDRIVREGLIVSSGEKRTLSQQLTALRSNKCFSCSASLLGTSCHEEEIRSRIEMCKLYIFSNNRVADSCEAWYLPIKIVKVSQHFKIKIKLC